MSNESFADSCMPTMMSTRPVDAASLNLPLSTSDIFPLDAHHLLDQHETRYTTTRNTYPAMMYAPTTLHFGASDRMKPPCRETEAPCVELLIASRGPGAKVGK